MKMKINNYDVEIKGDEVTVITGHYSTTRCLKNFFNMEELMLKTSSMI